MLKSILAPIIVVAAFAGIYILSSLLREKVMHKKNTFGCLGTGECGGCSHQCETCSLAEKKPESAENKD